MCASVGAFPQCPSSRNWKEAPEQAMNLSPRRGSWLSAVCAVCSVQWLWIQRINQNREINERTAGDTWPQTEQEKSWNYQEISLPSHHLFIQGCSELLNTIILINLVISTFLNIISFWMIFNLSCNWIKWLKDGESLWELLRVCFKTRHNVVEPEAILEAIQGESVCLCLCVCIREDG